MKRVYLPEIKRIIKSGVIPHNSIPCFTLVNRVPGHRISLPKSMLVLPYPRNCKKYEVRYRRSKNGKYFAECKPWSGVDNAIFDYETGTYLNLSCFIPDSWDGKRFNRYVKVIE